MQGKSEDVEMYNVARMVVKNSQLRALIEGFGISLLIISKWQRLLMGKVVHLCRKDDEHFYKEVFHQRKRVKQIQRPTNLFKLIAL